MNLDPDFKKILLEHMPSGSTGCMCGWQGDPYVREGREWRQWYGHFVTVLTGDFVWD